MTHLEIDLLVHAYIMGHMKTRFELSAYGYDEEGWFLAGDDYFTNIESALRHHDAIYLLWDEYDQRVPRYSTDEHAALRLARYCSTDQDVVLKLMYWPGFGEWYVRFGDLDRTIKSLEVNDLPLAICLSALCVIGIDIDPEEIVR